MTSHWLKHSSVGLLVAAFTLSGCSDGDDGKDGRPGPPGGSVIDASTASDEFLASLDVVSEIKSVKIASPPKVTFTLETADGIPIVGIVPFWEEDSRYIRFTMAKLVPGTNGDPDTWVSYTRDAVTNDPDYDTGTTLVDHKDGSYTLTFATDVTSVPGVTWQPGLTTRLGGQIGSSSVPLEPQNFAHDFVPNGGAMTVTRNIAVMDSCNECHDDLVFHGRRFKVEYCVTCHNPDLADGEGNMSYMIHRIHAAGEFAVLDDAISYAEVTYPQDLRNCMKCHNAMDVATPDANNWNLVPSIGACDGCHDVTANNWAGHPGGVQDDNSNCIICHSSTNVVNAHITPNATPNNPNLLPGQVEIVYDLVDATVDGGNNVTIQLSIFSDGAPLDVANLPADLAGPGRYPGLLFAWAEPQDGFAEPMDYNNLGERAGQAISIDLDDFLGGGTAGTHSYDGGTGVNTFVLTDAARQFPIGATLRAVGLQGYFQQDIGGEIISLHTPSAVVAVTGDVARRAVVDSSKCASCHEWFEGHGGNRTYNIQICTLCHVPNLSSTGRTVVDPTDRDLDMDLQAAIDAGTLDPSVDPFNPLTYPEDAQNLKDLVHGIHASGFRDRPFQHVRGPSRQGYYDWDEVTFPRGASTSNCYLCHLEGSYDLPLMDGLLATTVRTTGKVDGRDASVPAAEAAFVNVPNATDWVNTPTASSCVDCHTSLYAMAHMEQNGALLSNPAVPIGTFWSNRSDLGTTYESCAVCHGPGKTADLDVVHNK